MMKFRNSVLPLIVLFINQAFAITPEGAAVSRRGSSSSPVGMALVEWNTADLMQDKIRIAGEYLIIDGFAFGVASEFQRQISSSWNHATIGLGLSATQYLFHQRLQGLFVKGEIDIFATKFEGKNEWIENRGLRPWMAVGADVGYRTSFLNHLTGAASYGMRRNLTGFFEPTENSTPKVLRRNIRAWESRLQLSLGLAI